MKTLFFLSFLLLWWLPGAAQRNNRNVDTAALRGELTAIYDKDQKERAAYDETERRYGWGAREAQDARRQIQDMDRRHLRQIEALIDRLGGYPGRSLVGQPLDQVAFLIIQHSTDRAVHEKYLPLIREAAHKGDIDKASAAILTDQVSVQKGEKQVYGTQIRINGSGAKELYPVEDMTTLNQRRKEMDLEPIEVYLKRMGVKQ